MYIQEKTSDELPMATYIPFLALLAFKIFAAEQVDVAIMEVGLGEKYDATNVVQIPIVCGISSLGYDHMEILGAEACNTDQACEEVKDDSGICVRSCQNSSVFSSLPLAIKWLRDAAQKDRFVRFQVLVSCWRCLEIDKEMRLWLKRPWL